MAVEHDIEIFYGNYIFCCEHILYGHRKTIYGLAMSIIIAWLF